MVPQLESLDLSAKEASVYLALLEIGQCSAGKIITKTQLHRSVVYSCLDKLESKKLLTRLTKHKIAYFHTNEPERLVDNFQAQLDSARALLPALKRMQTAGAPEIAVYEGVEAYRRFWLESARRIPVGGFDYVAGSIGTPWIELLGPAVVKEYFKIAQQRKIGWKMIIFDIDDFEQAFLRQYPKFHYECRLIDETVVKEGNFNIFGDESVILHSATEPMIIEIKNQSLVKVFKNLFDILWKSGQPIDLVK